MRNFCYIQNNVTRCLFPKQTNGTSVAYRYQVFGVGSQLMLFLTSLQHVPNVTNLLVGEMEVPGPVIFLCMFFVWRWAVLTQRKTVAKPGCRAFCGETSIPYPFGVGEGCYKNTEFEIVCQNISGPVSDGQTYRPYLALFSIEVLELSFH